MGIGPYGRLCIVHYELYIVLSGQDRSLRRENARPLPEKVGSFDRLSTISLRRKLLKYAF